MKKTNFTVEFDSKTGKYHLIRFNTIYGSYTEECLHKRGFIIKNNILFEKTGKDQ